MKGLVRAGWLLAVLGAAWGAPGRAAAQDLGLPLGVVAPDAKVQDLEGNPVQLLDLVRGKPTLIEFWAVWCQQCEELEPQVARIQAEYGDRVNVIMVAVGVGQTPRRVRRHVDEHDPGYPYVFDARGEAVRAYNALTTTVVTLIDAQGRVAYVDAGTEQDLVAAVRTLLAAGGARAAVR